VPPIAVQNAQKPSRNRKSRRGKKRRNAQKPMVGAMGTNQSTISRRKQAILTSLRRKLRDHNGSQNSLHKSSVRCNHKEMKWRTLQV
jgi:hypothetical protein